MSKQYTRIDIGDGEIVTQCNDCGAYVINKDESAVDHYPSCRPTPDEWFKEDEE